MEHKSLDVLRHVADIHDAMRHVEDGHSRGKVVITVVARTENIEAKELTYS